ncbi:Endoribonuclease Dicer homolog 1-like protein [Drosera capensis]
MPDVKSRKRIEVRENGFCLDEVPVMTQKCFNYASLIQKWSCCSAGISQGFSCKTDSIVLDVDVEPSTTPWDPAKAYLFARIVGDTSVAPMKEIYWDLIENITRTDAWNNPLQRARLDVYLGTRERSLG